MEGVAFELRLLDQVSGTAKRSADSLRGVEKQAKKTQQALDFSKDLEKTEQQLKKLSADPKGYERLIKAQKELREQRKKLAEDAGIKKESFGEAFSKKLSLGSLATAAALGDILAEGALKIGEGLVETAHKVVEIFTEGLTKAFEESGKEETRRLAFKLSLGGKEGKESLEDIERFSKLTGYNKSEIAPTILKLRRAGFDQKAARQIFATGSDIEAAGGLSIDEFANFAEHLKLKGGVTTKQLVGAGVNAPEFYKKLGKKLGISADAAEKRAGEGGKVDPQLLLNLITESTNTKQGGIAGTGGLAASQTFERRLHKLKTLPDQYFEKLIDSPGFKRASDGLGKLLEKLSPESETGARIFNALDRAFEKLTGWFDKLSSDEGIDSIANGIESAIDLMGELIPAAKDAGAAFMDIVDSVSRLVDELRLVNAVASGDKGALQAVAKDIAIRANEKAYREQERAARKEGFGEGYGVLAGDVNSPLASVPAPAVARPGSGNKIIVQAPVTQHITAAPGEDPTHTAQKTKEKFENHTTSAMERAAQSRGAMK